ncbi:DUF1707 SHOCT-like domain-containing protein [Actinocorallia longicatena]|uniref:Cell wall-active antibiotic response 4TMS protein YvqF n=1 Tax=Actinocorallia longicatena TaxID=111803 RepID=A0ABP6QIT0_9ACTN
MDLEKKSDLRASDADRDAVAHRLGDALAEGRLTPEEHAERLDELYAAKTYAELDLLTRDLPGPAGEPKISLLKDSGGTSGTPVQASNTIVAIFGGAERKGRWLAEPHTTITAAFGGVELDYRQAVLTRREVVVDVKCIFGGIDITVPPGVRVVTDVSAIFGACEDPKNDTVDPQAPVIRITGFVLFGGVSFKRRTTKERRKKHC